MIGFFAFYPHWWKVKKPTENFKSFMISIRIHPFYFFILFFLFFLGCNRDLRTHISNKNNNLKLYLEPTVVDINILFLRSISSKNPPDHLTKETIQKVSNLHSNWFNARLKRQLLQDGIAVVNKEHANTILETKIVDMGEIRAKMFLEGLSIGLVFGLIAGEVTGDPAVGLGVFLWEVVEEIIIVYILKTYFMVTTVEFTAKSMDGKILRNTEFTAYSNESYLKNLPDFTKDLKENKVRGSLEQNAKDISRFLSGLKENQ
ncbi:hypothetical protein P3G55_02000 [Leptospira sp. 96542]|nr:hypothetical protein [Leptospira sp. 96542]